MKKLVTDFIKELMLMRLDQSNLFESGETYYLKQQNLDKVIHLINESLTYLHTRYVLLKKNALIEFTLPHTFYYLREEYSQTLGATYHKYIRDSVYNPFYGNVIRILAVIDERGVRLPINNFNDYSSVFITEQDCIQITSLNVSDYFDVIYQANHIPILSTDLETQYLNIPTSLYEPLSYLITSKMLSGHTGQSFLIEAQKNTLKFTELMIEFEKSGIVDMNSDSSSHSYFEHSDYI